MSLIWMSGLVALSFGVETASGFGSMIVALTLGGLWLPLERLMVVLVPLNLVVSAAILARDGRQVEWPTLVREVVPPMALGMAVGLGAVALLEGSEVSPGRAAGLKVAYAGLVVALAARETLGFGERAPSRRSPARWLMLGGVAHGAFAASGPMVVYAMDARAPDQRSFRATLAVLWLASNLAVLLGPTLRPLLSRETLGSSAALLPAMAVGMVAGEKIHRWLSVAQFRTAVFGLMLLTGSLLLAANLTSAHMR